MFLKPLPCLRFAEPQQISRIAHPAVLFFELVVKKTLSLSAGKIRLESGVADQQGIHEFRSAVALAKASRLIGAAEERIVLSASEFSRRPVSGIMLPASEIVMIPVTDNLADAFVKAHLDMHTRYPICEREKEPQTIIGYVNFKDIVNVLKVKPASPNVRGIARPIPSVNGSSRLSDTLSQMIHDKIHIALVRDENSRVIGLIALEDLIEELVGDIEDEYDRLPGHIHVFGSSWIVGGGVSISHVSSVIGRDFVDATQGKSKTFSEWINQKLGRSPEPGEIFQIENLTITARKLRRKKIYEGIVSLAEAES